MKKFFTLFIFIGVLSVSTARANPPLKLGTVHVMPLMLTKIPTSEFYFTQILNDGSFQEVSLDYLNQKEKIPAVLLATEKSTGKRILFGTNTDPKKALIEVSAGLQFLALGARVSVEMLRTLEIGVQAGFGGGTEYGAFANLHIFRFKRPSQFNSYESIEHPAPQAYGDVYLGSHLRERNRIPIECQFPVACYAYLSGRFHDLRIGYRHSEDKFYMAFEVGVGKFANGGAVYKSNEIFIKTPPPEEGTRVQRIAPVIKFAFGLKIPVIERQIKKQ